MVGDRVDFDLSFVCFIDLLGFTNMVKKDLEAPKGSQSNFEKLYAVHQKTLNLNREALGIQLVQFSDSVVLSIPFDTEKFPQFLDIIGKYQYDLFCEGILARGGLAYGKHLYRDGFMYSLGLIEAYRLESSIARYPRIIVSADLLDLVSYNYSNIQDLPLIKEEDGVVFIDFIDFGSDENNLKNLNTIVNSYNGASPSILEKHRWLEKYYCYKFPNDIIYNDTFTKIS